MKKKKKKKSGYRILLFGLVALAIIAAAIVAAIIHNKPSFENYSQMESAVLPLVTLHYGDGYETELHGYVNEMDADTMRDVIVPLSDDKTLAVYVDTFESELSEVSYEIRSLDHSEYIDGGTFRTFSSEGGKNVVEIKASDLLENGVEYQLILKAVTAEKTVYYYTRIISGNSMHTEELLSFVEEFSTANFDRDKAAGFIVNYIQPEDSSDTTDFYYTDIHSKYSMFTFGNLEVERGTDEEVRMTELSPTQLSVTLQYSMRMYVDEEWKDYQVEEFFCVRIRSEKVYLLDYFRKIEQTFNAEESTREKGRIQLGIGNGETQVETSENSDYTVFVIQKELWRYCSATNAMNLIFSFNDVNDASSRDNFDHHDIQIVNVSDDGDVDYMVYGYMNRGSFEGQVGICFYRYMADTNSTKRLFFLPVTQSEQMLMMDLGTLAYVNQDDVCYLRYGDGIYSIDLQSGETVEVTISAYPGTYAFNKGGNVVAWQEGDDLTYPSRLVILNMDAQTTLVVNAPAGEFVKILDFMGDDIVYGFGSPDDSVIQANIDTFQLMNKVMIASTDESLAVQKEYDAQDCFITSAYVDGTRLVIERGKKTENGSLQMIEDEVLLLTQTLAGNTGKSMIKSKTADLQKKEYYIQTSGTVGSDSQFSSVTPRFEVKDSTNELNITHHQDDGYYVYGYGKLLYVESEINVAISEAYDVMGVVVDQNMNYIWTRGTRDLAHTISVQQGQANTDGNTLADALEILCSTEGIQLDNAEEALASGEDPVSIINSAFGEDRALNLYGCTLAETLYFINAGHPVIAVMGDREAVVIVGYDLENVTIYMPFTGETTVSDMEGAESYFLTNNNSFISYR